MAGELPVTPVAIYFPEYEPGAPLVPLAAVCGVGGEAGRKLENWRCGETGADTSSGGWRVVSSIDEADVCVYPAEYRDGEFTRRAMAECKRRGLPLVFSKDSDDPTPVHLDYGVIYRESIEASRMTPSERALPALDNDLLCERPGSVVIRQKRAIPSVGFCGFVGSALRRGMYTLTGRRQKVAGLRLRHRALSRLARTPGIECRFVVRSSFWGGAVGRFHRNDDLRAQVRREYLDNLFGTDYTLCLRGAGNFSFRFYETLAVGRIPLFINTDCALPFPDRIDWRRHCVWVEERDIDRAGEILKAFHERTSPEEFAELQRANRRLWKEWLSPRGFYDHALRDAAAGRTRAAAG